ncbi:sporulation-delaying protein SdpB family protein [Sungkyunkwania multivorans]|uniref:Sporulation-delaying protein SdpB family protein n=1 Tax=Sungkyunkwania multivorans TaxID=1173618 RepID=A0ABW3CWN6_9FLAO
MKAIEKITSKNQFTNLYGFTRSLLALGTLITLAFNHPRLLFFYGLNFETRYINESSLTFFSLFPDEYLILAKVIAIIALLIVIIGIYPRYFGIVHWYITFSFLKDCPVVDGGDQIASILTLLLIPLTLLDARKNHWNDPSKKNDSPYKQIIAHFMFFLIQLQVSFIYFDAAVSKLSVKEWMNGTAVYYWFTSPTFGVHPWLEPLVFPLLRNPISLTMITWGAIFLELLLAAALFMNYGRRKYLLFAGIAFHFLIILVHGLPSFFCSMTACLILYLLPSDHRFNMEKIKSLRITLSKAIKKNILSLPKRVSSGKLVR